MCKTSIRHMIRPLRTCDGGPALCRTFVEYFPVGGASVGATAFSTLFSRWPLPEAARLVIRVGTLARCIGVVPYASHRHST
jgi:hypothetical protein